MPRASQQTQETAERVVGLLEAAVALFAGIPGAQMDRCFFETGFRVRLDPAFGISADAEVRLLEVRRGRHQIVVNVGWSSCSGGAGMALAQSALIRSLAEPAAIVEIMFKDTALNRAQADAVAALYRERAPGAR